MRDRYLSLIGLGLVLTGCTGPVIMGTDAAIVYVTKPGGAPPADTQDQIAQHESWCYQTMGDTQCFAHPQNVPPDRLVNVDPQSSYPLDPAAYRQALITKIAPPLLSATGQPVALKPISDAQVERESLKTELDAPPPPPAVAVQTP